MKLKKDLKNTLQKTFALLRQNWKPILLFSAPYAVLYVFIVVSLQDLGLWVSTRIMGVSYVGSDNLMELVTGQYTAWTLLIAAVCMVFIMVFQLGALYHAFTASWHGNKTTVQGMITAGAEACRLYLFPTNWMLIPFLLILLPVTQLISLSNRSMYMMIPEFISDAISANTVYSTSLHITYVILYLLTFAGIFAPLLFLVYRMPFNKAYRKSCSIARKHYKEMFLSVLAVNVILYLSATAVSAIIARVYSECGAALVDAGILTVTDDVGNKLYIISDLICAFLAPVLNNAVLAALLFKYEEQNEIHQPLPSENLTDYRANKVLLAGTGFVLLLICAFNLYHYGDTIANILKPSSRPEIVAHRGDSARAPENTIAAFELALPEYPDGIELDVHETKDGVIIVSHDDNLSRVARQELFVHDLTYEELIQYDVGSWFGEQFADVRISTLDEILKLFKDKLPVQIEIKPTAYDRDLEEKVLQVIYDNDMQDQVSIVCLKPEPLKRIKELDPSIQTVYCMALAWGHIETIPYADILSVEEGNITKSMVENIHNAGKKVYTWTINSEENVQYLVDCGVDGILTDDPIMLENALTKTNYSGGLEKILRFISGWITSGI